MDKYGTLTECPKCGYDKQIAEFIPSHIDTIDGEQLQVGESEYIKVSCYRCRYTWKEAPLDIDGEPINIKESTLCDTPQTKNTIVFEDRFIEKIRLEYKTYTVRNSPVALGCYKIDDDLTIEVHRCQKQTARETIFNNGKAWKFYNLDVLEDDNDWCVSHESLGFNSQEEMYKFYKSYLKRDYAYHIDFIIKENGDKS